jgi:phosphoesterase RecJ-like protein
MIAELLVNSYETTLSLKLSKEAAQLLYAGIIGDTGRFLYSNTTERTLVHASMLMRFGINPKEIYDELYKTTKETAKLQGYVLQNFEVTQQGVASLFITKELMQEFNVEPVEAANLVNIEH